MSDQAPPSEHDQLVWMTERMTELEQELRDSRLDAALGWSLKARVATLEAALQVIPPEKLEWLADWLDMIDRRDGRSGDEVQRALRRMAHLSREAGVTL